MLPVTRQFDAALQVVRELRAAGYEAYLAGGCVRDLLLGREPKDFDVATSATPDVVLGLFPRTFAVGAHFGVVLVADGDEEGYVTTEVATFRSDGAYSDGRHPNEVQYTTSAEEDVKRRDFTVNGLLLDAVRAAGFIHCAEEQPQVLRLPSVAQDDSHLGVIDFVGGVADLEAGVVRAIGRAEERFEEDHLRMLRGVRFAARFGFEIEEGTKKAIRGLAGKTAAVSRE